MNVFGPGSKANDAGNESNCAFFPFQLDYQKIILIVSIENIPKGTEITVDYQANNDYTSSSSDSRPVNILIPRRKNKMFYSPIRIFVGLMLDLTQFTMQSYFQCVHN